MKHLWYIFECLCENRDALARGIVTISDYGGATIGHFDPGLLRRQHTIMAEVFPLHLRSIHLIYPNEVGELIVTGVAPNELTSTEDCDPWAKTPWHKYVPARVEVL